MATRLVLVAVLWFVAAPGRHAAFPAPSGFQGAAPARPVESSRNPARIETLLVFPFENASRIAKLDWLSEGLAELTIERLAGEGQYVFPREERLAALERIGLPASTRFSRATMLKIAEEIDADYIVFGQYAASGRTLTVTARVLRVSPPHLTPPVQESGGLDNLMEIHARLAWRLLCAAAPASAKGTVAARICGPLGLSERDFAQRLPRRRLDAFEYYIRGLLSSDRESEAQWLRDLREAARLEPAWDAPAFALGQNYFARRDCVAALPWLSRVPSAHGRGLEASFYVGVCHLLRNDLARAEAAFATLLELARGRPENRKGAAGAEVDLPEAVNNLGVAHARLGKPREAAVDFARAAHLDPEDPDYWFNLGLAAMRAHDAAAAVERFREALRRSPEDSEARALLITALEQSGRTPEAAAERKQAVQAGDRLAAAPSLSADALVRLDRIKMRLDTASLRQWAVHPEAGSGAGETR